MSSRTALVAVVLVTSLPLQAHDIYSHLRDEAGGSCCEDRDCQPVPYRFIASGVQMFVDKRWIDVPSDRIQYRALPGDRRNRRRTLVWFNLRTGLQQPRHPVHDQMRNPAASICIGTLSHAERNIRGTVSKEQDAGSAGQVTLVLRSRVRCCVGQSASADGERTMRNPSVHLP